MTERGSMPVQFGFRTAKRSAHQGRSIMSQELCVLVEALGRDTDLSGYKAAILDDNILEKQTASNRKITYEFLLYIYGMDRALPLYRALLQLWPKDKAQQRLLAFQLALARDALLAEIRDTVKEQLGKGPVSV